MSPRCYIGCAVCVSHFCRLCLSFLSLPLAAREIVFLPRMILPAMPRQRARNSGADWPRQRIHGSSLGVASAQLSHSTITRMYPGHYGSQPISTLPRRSQPGAKPRARPLCTALDDLINNKTNCFQWRLIVRCHYAITGHDRRY